MSGSSAAAPDRKLDQSVDHWADHTATSIACSDAQMLQRTARYASIPTSPRAFVDTYLPAHQRRLHSVIGNGVTDDPNFKPAIAAAEHFHVDYITADAGKGAALHAHDTEEVFVAMRGRWQIYWLDTDAATGLSNRRTLDLEECDVISVPPLVMRGFTNLDGERGLLMSILGGKTPGRVKWDRSVAQAAQAIGVGFDDQGNATRMT
jgi:mannose-6-phosphate isomerase-like protein (cupin superfamily)